MSIDDERELHEHMDRVFATSTAPAAPVDGAMRRGKTIRLRRRAAVAAGLAAVVAAGVITVPALRHDALAPAPASGNYTVTVQPPGPHAPAGEIASGTIDGQQWQVRTYKPGTNGPRGLQSILVSGAGSGPGGIGEAVPALTVNQADPVGWQASANSTVQVQFGAVPADVSYVTVRLGNGTMLTLHPVTVFGVRAVAFAAPLGITIVDAAAYSRHGEIATAIPFSYPGEMASFETWLKPGQHGLGRASGRIGSGTFDGHAWSARAYLGPWGICFLVAGDSPVTRSCIPAVSTLGTSVLFRSGVDPNVAGGTASASVARLVVHRSDGVTVQVRPVRIGQQKFFVFPMRNGDKALTWKAYDSSGRLVASWPG